MLRTPWIVITMMALSGCETIETTPLPPKYDNVWEFIGHNGTGCFFFGLIALAIIGKALSEVCSHLRLAYQARLDYKARTKNQ